MSLQRLIDLLGASLPDLGAEDIADALYLAVYLGRVAPTTTAPQASSGPVAPELSQPPQNSEPASAPTASSATSAAPVAPQQRHPASAAGVGLYVQRATDAHEALGFRTPRTASLPRRNELVRTLRPLQMRVPSRQQQALDILATVQQIAETRIWLPVLRPLAEARFKVVLVMDDTPAMAIWESMVYELALLLQRHSAFREVRVYRLGFDKADVALLTPGLGQNSGTVPRPAYGEIADPSGQTLVLVVSDAVGRHWRDQRAAWAIADWARQGLVSLVQVLPANYWDRSALGMWPAARISAGAPGAPNRRLRYVARRGRLGRAAPSGIPLPVLNLEPDSLASWAKLAAGIPDASHPAYLLPSTASAARADLGAARQTDPDTLVAGFLSSASASAQRLAGLLASAAPLSLPIARLVQNTMLPASHPVHLAEVWLSGLVRRADDTTIEKLNPEEVLYDFRAGVRERLLHMAPASDSLAVLRAVSAYIGVRLGQPRDFRAWAQDGSPLAADDPRRPFAAVAATVLHNMGGAYRDLAERLAHAGGAELGGAIEPERPRGQAGETDRDRARHLETDPGGATEPERPREQAGASDEDIGHQRELLAVYRSSLHLYLNQQAMIGATSIPPGLAHSVTEAREQIKRIKANLRSWGVPVEDRLDDDETLSPAELPAPSDEAIAQQRARLRIHRQTLAILLAQLEIFGATQAPPNLSYNISDNRARIGRIEAALRSWGVPLEGEPEDESATPADLPASPVETLSQTPDETIVHQQDLLAAHRRTLDVYLKQQAMFGTAYIPPAVGHGIIEARAQIKRIKANLRSWGVQVQDDLDDDEALTPAMLPAPSSEAIERLQARLGTHRQTLRVLLDQYMQYGAAYASPAVIHGITEARAQIQRIKEALRAWGVQVEDHPDDVDESGLIGSVAPVETRAIADVLLVTVTNAETDAVLDAFRERSGGRAAPMVIDGKTYYELGTIGGARTFLARIELGAGGMSGAVAAANIAIDELRPRAMIIVGLAFGIDSHRQQIGDILIAGQVALYGPQRAGGDSQARPRAERAACSPLLLDRFRAGGDAWQGARLHYGLLLSGESLIESQALRGQLLRLEPETIGGQLEGAGLYTAAQHKQVDWIIVRAIADWADDQKGADKARHRELAARNVAAFTAHVIAEGGLAGLPNGAPAA